MFCIRELPTAVQAISRSGEPRKPNCYLFYEGLSKHGSRILQSTPSRPSHESDISVHGKRLVQTLHPRTLRGRRKRKCWLPCTLAESSIAILIKIPKPLRNDNKKVCENWRASRLRRRIGDQAKCKEKSGSYSIPIY